VKELRRGKDEAQRWISILVGIGILFLCGWMTYEATNPRPIKKDADGAAAVSSSNSSSSSDGGNNNGPVIAIDDSTPRDLDAGLFLQPLTLGDAGILPSGGPRSVKVGLVFVTFRGADGAPANARDKREALTIAERLSQDAKGDFHKAVTGGDSGSSDDIGRIYRGHLDPRTESAIFALNAGEVTDVLETSRGFWIVKRIE
jgi:hypothetical protein